MIKSLYFKDNELYLLDQRRLPSTTTWIRCNTATEVADAIRDMVVRGAPAIGIAAAYGVCLSVRQAMTDDRRLDPSRLSGDLDRLANSRPTAVNLAWALDRMQRSLEANAQHDPYMVALETAARIEQEDVDANLTMGQLGAALIEPGKAVLTHCNTGALATGGHGTALGVIRSAWGEGRVAHVFADETRPWLQGARLTAWELVQDGIPGSLICEGAAASLMARGDIGWVIVGADRIAANGDTANKIGTYGLAVLARHHGVRFMVVAPSSTLDPACPDGAAIPIEERPGSEITHVGGVATAPEGIGTWNPAFDVTPHDLIDVIVTERGVVHHPNAETMADFLKRSGTV